MSLEDFKNLQNVLEKSIENLKNELQNKSSQEITDQNNQTSLHSKSSVQNEKNNSISNFLFKTCTGFNLENQLINIQENEMNKSSPLKKLTQEEKTNMKMKEEDQLLSTAENINLTDNQLVSNNLSYSMNSSKPTVNLNAPQSLIQTSEDDQNLETVLQSRLLMLGDLPSSSSDASQNFQKDQNYQLQNIQNFLNFNTANGVEQLSNNATPFFQSEENHSSK